MSGRVNGAGDRIRDLQQARRGGARPPQPSTTPAEVLGMIDRVIANYGVDPREATDPQGWRRLSLGSAECRAGVVPWSATERYLVVFAPLLRLPTKSRQLGKLYRLLLELNHEATLGARFSIRGEILFVAITRPTRGLDEVEVEDAILSVLTIADLYDERLEEFLGRLPPAMAQLPDIKLRPKQALAIGARLAYANPHAQLVFRTMMEEWHRKGHPIDPGENGISLKARVGEKSYALGYLAPALARHPGTIILAWRALERYQVFPPEAVEAFQTAVSASTNLTLTETNAHLAVTEEFGKEAARALVRELDRLAQTGDPARDVEVAFAGDPDLPQVSVGLTNGSLHRLQETFRRCEPPVREIFARLIQGWANAGGTVECRRPGRVYLKLRTAEHEFGKFGVVSHFFNLAALAAPRAKRGPAVDLHWNLAEGDFAYLSYVPEAVEAYKKKVSALPGFWVEGASAAVEVGPEVNMKRAEELLEAMVGLKKAAGAG
jgi:hypothetical protein